jgi:hypothetical protein
MAAVNRQIMMDYCDYFVRSDLVHARRMVQQSLFARSATYRNAVVGHCIGNGCSNKIGDAHSPAAAFIVQARRLGNGLREYRGNVCKRNNRSPGNLRCQGFFKHHTGRGAGRRCDRRKRIRRSPLGLVKLRSCALRFCHGVLSSTMISRLAPEAQRPGVTNLGQCEDDATLVSPSIAQYYRSNSCRHGLREAIR